MRIAVEHLVVRRGGAAAVNDVSFAVPPACWTGIVGANGSGKTSLLRGLAGRLEIHGGEILIDGVDRTADRAWRARNLGFGPELAALPPSLTGAELFTIVAPEWREAVRSGGLSELRDALAFDAFLAERIGALSAGMRQRLAIFSAFLRAPSGVILDEPFNWLDPVCAYDTRAALRRLVDEGLTLCTALHETATLVGFCDSGLLLSQGRVGGRLEAADLARGRQDYGAFEADMIAVLRGLGGGVGPLIRRSP
jgi:ABC-2 type transport system ATP-binding protein